MSERPYLSIGEVLGLLLEEFPDVTISKIRFLESQGLIDPERTPSGYRKFYDPDVERLRVILREQRENFLPLRVIRDRLESGEIDDTGGHEAPRGIRNVVVAESRDDATGPVVVHTAHHPAAGGAAGNGAPAAAQPVITEPWPSTQANPAAAFFSSTATDALGAIEDTAHDSYLAAELCAAGGITSAQLGELQSFGIVAGKGTSANSLYSATDLAIVRAAAAFLARGVEPRHLRGWRQAAEREASLFEQLVLPLIRQRNPHSRQQAARSLLELAALGGELRSALLASTLAHHLDG